MRVGVGRHPGMVTSNTGGFLTFPDAQRPTRSDLEIGGTDDRVRTRDGHRRSDPLHLRNLPGHPPRAEIRAMVEAGASGKRC